MIHPSEIMRANSDLESQFSAPINNRRGNQIDCGWGALPCLADRLNLQKWAKAGVFLSFFNFLGLFQGALLNFFRGTSHHWMGHYQFDENYANWLLYINELFVGIFALLITYWGNRIHRVSWFGGLTIFQTVACVMLIIPELHESHVDNFINNTASNYLCTNSFANLVDTNKSNYIALAILLLFQLTFSFATISFYTLGISYLDDNIGKENSPTYLAMPMAAKIFGKQLGLYLSWVPTLSGNPKIFTTPMWLTLACIVFILASIITMFPRSLPSVVMKKAVASLLSLAVGDGDDDDAEEAKDGFFVTLLRLLKNPVLMMNIAACTVMGIANVNLDIFQNKFFQSRFFVQVGSDLSGYQDNIISQITNIIKYPFIGTSLIATGFILAKVRPKAKYLALFNVMVYSVTTISFITFAFLSCDNTLQSEMQNKLTTPFCSRSCGCSRNAPFMPVCTVEGQKTYFSPCHAGCTTVSVSNTKIYSNCTCGENIFQITDTSATEGSCSQDSCSLYFGFAQAGIVMSSSFMVSTIITNIIINLRIVQPKDKAMALALESTFLGILPYIPGKMVYAAIAETLCRFHGEDKCLLNSKSFGLFFSITTIALMGISALIAVGVVLMIGDVNLFSEKEEETSDDRDDSDDRDRRLSEDFRNIDDNLDFRLRHSDDQQIQRRQNQSQRTPSEMLESSF